MTHNFIAELAASVRRSSSTLPALATLQHSWCCRGKMYIPVHSCTVLLDPDVHARQYVTADVNSWPWRSWRIPPIQRQNGDHHAAISGHKYGLGYALGIRSTGSVSKQLGHHPLISVTPQVVVPQRHYLALRPFISSEVAAPSIHSSIVH